MASKHIRLRLLNEFNCTGSECPASCCSYGWNIDVDAETHKKWQQLNDEEKELKLLDSLIYKPESNKYYLKHIDNQCTHLSDTGLCTIQLKLGHEYIPETCRIYPRKSWRTGKYQAESLSLSCPEVLNLLLAESNENLFEYSKKGKVKNIETGEPTIPDEFGSLLDDYIFQVMKNNKYSVNILLLTITKKLIDISLLSQQSVLGVTELQKELKNVSHQIKAVKDNVQKNLISNTPDNTGRFWHLVFLMGQAVDNSPSELNKYKGIIYSKLETSYKSNNAFEDIGNDIKKYRRNFYNNPPAFYRDFMCRYLRVRFINNAFPRSPIEGNLIAEFLNCILPYTLIQLYVWVATEDKDQLSEQDVMEIVYSVERKLDHNEKIYKFLSEHPELLRIDTYYTCLIDV